MVLAEAPPTTERKIWITGKCEQCGYSVSLPTTPSLFAASSIRLLGLAGKHEKEHRGHNVKFSQT